jgi:serine phosphatase RsbU (regulator of sigma subunit)
MSVKAHCMRSAIYVPLKVRERIIGILGVDTPSPHKRFSTKHLQYLSAFGNHLAVALQNLELRGEAENRRIIEAQLQTAREIQASFLPSQPIRVQGLDYAAKMVPAMYVGGDFYDWMFLKDGRIAFAIGDVSGKGVPAALSMARIMGFLRGLTATLDNAGQIIKTLNKSLLGSEIAGVFTTMALAIFDANGKTLELSIAGHPPPVIYPATRRTCELLTGDYGPPLGVVQDLNWQSVTRKLAANDLVVFYTDGIVEAGAKAIDIKPLQQVVEKTAGLAPHQIVQGILDSIASDEARHDDATLLALKVV